MYRGAQGMTWYKGLCTGAHGGCTGNVSENTGSDRGRQGIFIMTGVFRASSV